MSISGAYGLNFPIALPSYSAGGGKFLKNFASRISNRLDTPQMRQERDSIRQSERMFRDYGVQKNSALGAYFDERLGINRKDGTIGTLPYFDGSKNIRMSGSRTSARDAATIIGGGAVILGAGVLIGWATLSDFDADRLSNIDEWVKYDTSVFQSDSDGDGILDGDEVYRGTDPRFDRPPGYQPQPDDDSDMPPAYPPRDGDNGQIPTDCSDGWRVNGYFTPVETDYDNSREAIRVDGSIRSYDSDFLDEVRDQGWGKTRHNDYLGWDGRDFFFSSTPRDAGGFPLNIGDAATDRSVIEEQTKFTVPTLPGTWGDVVYKAMDVRDDTDGKEVALYTGQGEDAEEDASDIERSDERVCIVDE